MTVTFHRLIAHDVRSVLAYYEQEAGFGLSQRFYQEFERLALQIQSNPHRFHAICDVLRRANLQGFPYHLLYRVTTRGEIRILVLRHHRRDPNYGAERR